MTYTSESYLTVLFCPRESLVGGKPVNEQFAESGTVLCGVLTFIHEQAGNEPNAILVVIGL